MSTLRFDQIGNINKDTGDNFVIGPIPGVGGPFCNAADYYCAWQLCRKKTRATSIHFRNEYRRPPNSFPNIPSGPFALSHPDFGYHNFLVDDDLAVIDWSGERVQPIEFAAVFPMFLSSLHPIFWKGGRFDNEERRNQEAKLAIQRGHYVEAIRVEAQRCQVISEIDQQYEYLRVKFAEGMVKYDEGNLNPWEWLIDLLESDINVIDSGSREHQVKPGTMK